MINIQGGNMENLTNQNEYYINANPTKSFFIDMLIRDIALEPAIAELVDNSLDGAKMFRKKFDYDGECNIEVHFDDKEFTITDLCGGISQKDAREYCFRFGRDESRKFELENGTGVFGIGMKRALFRMGREFEIVSVTPTEHFRIHVDVDKWLEDKGTDWSFKFDEISLEPENNPFEKCGTTIVVRRLYSPISNSFKNPYFNDSFVQYVKRRSSMIKELGVNVVINDKNIIYDDEKILFDEGFKPYIKTYEFEGVKIRIIAGCGTLGTPKKAGWYVECNGRMVLFANQGEETGWGTEDVRPFHVSFAPFRGVVSFEASDLRKLPWNTMKTGIDLSSKYYQMALEDMRDVERIFIKWRNQVNEFLEANENIKAESIFSGTPYSFNSEQIMKYAQTNAQFIFPELTSEKFPVPPEPETVISFKREKKRVESAKKALGNIRMSNKEFGEEIFEYFFERETEEDE